jgi:hypothetical protein
MAVVGVSNSRPVALAQGPLGMCRRHGPLEEDLVVEGLWLRGRRILAYPPRTAYFLDDRQPSELLSRKSVGRLVVAGDGSLASAPAAGNIARTRVFPTAKQGNRGTETSAPGRQGWASRNTALKDYEPIRLRVSPGKLGRDHCRRL